MQWRQRYGTATVTSAKLVKDADLEGWEAMHDALLAVGSTNGYALNATKLGQWLGRQAGKVLDGHAIRKGPTIHRTVTWCMV